MGAGLVFAIGLLSSRLLGLGPDIYLAWSPAAVPLVALVAGVVMTLARGVGDAEAARRVDRAMQTKDLFLTAVMLHGAPGAYKPLVASEAETRASQIDARRVAPLAPMRRTGHVTVMMLMLLAGTSTSLLPQLDPFGLHEEESQKAKRLAMLKEQQEQTKKRLEALEAKDLDEELSAEAKRAVEALTRDLATMRKETPESNTQTLNGHQKFIGEKWRQAREQSAGQQNRNPSGQRLGQMDSAKRRQWEKELAEGKTDTLKEEMKEIQDLIKQAQQQEGLDKEKTLSQMASKLQDLADFMREGAGSEELERAMKRMMSQMQMAKQQGMSDEAMKAMQQSLELSQQELADLAQAIRDMQELERALQAIQQAKQLNSQNKLGSGDNPDAPKTLEDYRMMYEQMLAEQHVCQDCNGSGQCEGGACPSCGGTGRRIKDKNIGGGGIGEGGASEEDDSVPTDFKSEKSKSAFTAGKILMKWKTQELGAEGEVEYDRAASLRSVKQGADEAILQEQIPPGYHEAIKTYFDSIEQAEAADDPE
jgi:hypothetical protein